MPVARHLGLSTWVTFCAWSIVLALLKSVCLPQLYSKTGPECGVQETPAPVSPGKFTLSHYTNAYSLDNKVEFLDFLNMETYYINFNKEEENGAGL